MGVPGVELFWRDVPRHFVYDCLGDLRKVSFRRASSLPCEESGVNENFFVTEPLPVFGYW